MIKKLRPECTENTNPKKELIFVSTLLVRVLTENQIEKASKYVILRWVLPVKKFPIGSDLRESKA
jgi:hypothetical protein